MRPAPPGGGRVWCDTPVVNLEPPLARWQHCAFNKARDSRHRGSLTRDTNQCVCDITTLQPTSDKQDVKTVTSAFDPRKQNDWFWIKEHKVPQSFGISDWSRATGICKQKHQIPLKLACCEFLIPQTNRHKFRNWTNQTAFLQLNGTARYGTPNIAENISLMEHFMEDLSVSRLYNKYLCNFLKFNLTCAVPKWHRMVLMDSQSM